MPKKISITQDKWNAARGWKSWLVVIPARLSPTKRRQYRRYRTKSEAEQAVATLQNMDRTLRTPSILAPLDTDTLRLSQNILEGTGITITMAASLVARALPSLEGTGYDIPAAAALVHHLHHQYGSVDIALNLIHGGAGKRATAPTLARALDELNTAKATLSPITARTRNQFFRTLFRRNPGLEETPLDALSTQDIADILDKTHPNTPTAWNSTARELSSLYSYAIKKEWINDNPIQRLERKYIVEKEIHACTPDELIRLFQACRPPTREEKETATHAAAYDKRILLQDTSCMQLYVALCAFAGVRPEEVLRLHWHDISVEDQVVSVRSKSSKTGGTRHIAITPVLMSWLEYCSIHEQTPDQLIIPHIGIKYKLAALHRRSGYNEIHPWQKDCLRHSFATYKLKIGTPLHEVQIEMGHTTTRLILSRYMNMRGITKAMAETWWSLTPQAVAN